MRLIDVEIGDRFQLIQLLPGDKMMGCGLEGEVFVKVSHTGEVLLLGTDIWQRRVFTFGLYTHVSPVRRLSVKPSLIQRLKNWFANV